VPGRPEVSSETGEQACDSDRAIVSRRHVVRLQAATVAWMWIECGVALFAAVRAHSPALVAFGCDSFLELLSALVVLSQFLPAVALSKVRAARLAGTLLLILAGVVTLTSVGALAAGVRPEPSWIGMGVTVAALALMPALAWAKRRAARTTGNAALAADAVQSATCGYLAAITLAGLAVNAAWHAPWIDPMAALAAVPLIVREGRRALRGEMCHGC
jgi:divalent metal cation (Fe/Co/Zn/Cd) transporter